jgi:hypothetical protein
MALELLNLDSKTRSEMVKEIDSDQRTGTLFFGKLLRPQARGDYAGLLRQAAVEHDDAWLADALRRGRMMKTHTERATQSGGATLVAVRRDAPQMLAEGEFNRFYMRGLCARAISENIPKLVIYRAKEVANPRPESMARLGQLVDAARLLEDLRENVGDDTVLGVPGGPNSGMSVRLP